MARIKRSIEVDVAAPDAYDQWTQFESFPQFMDGVDRVTQEDDRTLSWEATIAGIHKTWRAEITDQTPSVRIAWKSIEGAENAGAVLFTPLGPGRCAVELTLDAEPDNPLEAVGTAFPILERQVAGDLERFKAFIEQRGAPTGAWTGEIHGERVESPR
ncbi:MAG TPA: SRPBCC family protein [Candidatus Limnocylindrales bacterium]